MSSSIRIAVAALTVLLTWAGAVHAVVGPTDVCPLPTPYPPASAGAGVILNPDTEAGFTTGAANGWVAWQDGGYTALHLAGTDRFFNGAAAQRINMPQPSASIGRARPGFTSRFGWCPGPPTR